LFDAGQRPKGKRKNEKGGQVGGFSGIIPGVFDEGIMDAEKPSKQTRQVHK